MGNHFESEQSTDETKQPLHMPSLHHEWMNDSDDIAAELFEQSMDAIVFWHEGGIIFQVNESACKIFESDREELIGSQIDQYVLNKDKTYLNMLETFEKNGELRDELFFKMPNGQTKLLEFTAKKHHAKGYNLTIFRNVSERWLIEFALRRSEHKFRKIFESSLDGILLWTQEKFVDINKIGAEIIGLSKERLLKMTVEELFNLVPGNKEKLCAHREMVKKNEIFTSTIPISFKNGTKKHIELSTRENIYSNMYLTIIRDVTEKMEMQEQIRKSDTLNVVGELAAGIAHEIRNPMTAIKGFVQLLQGNLQDEYASYFHVIKTELERIEDIITEFLYLAKPQASIYLKQNVGDILKETIDLLTAQAILNNIQIDFKTENSSCIAYCEGNQLKQVFINIIKNALEVSENNGVVAITLKQDNHDYYRISISDKGHGIPKEKLKKLGEPFYTTKERGTGLGLMVSYKIIEEHQGYIEVESEVGKGTTFHIFLPVYKWKD